MRLLSSVLQTSTRPHVAYSGGAETSAMCQHQRPTLMTRAVTAGGDALVSHLHAYARLHRRRFLLFRRLMLSSMKAEAAGRNVVGPVSALMDSVVRSARAAGMDGRATLPNASTRLHPHTPAVMYAC